MKIKNTIPINSLGTLNLANVKIGQVIDWWRPDPSFSVPSNFVILDGSTINDSESPFDGLTLPNCNTRFIRGGNTGSLNNTGGNSSQSFAHTHTSAHSHTSDTHSHGGQTDFVGTPLQGQDNGGYQAPHDAHSHNHNLTVLSVAVGSSGASNTTSGSSTLASVDILPTFMRCLKIMRIK